MLINLQNANIKESSRLLKESRMCVFSKVWGMGLQLRERKGLTYRYLFLNGKIKLWIQKGMRKVCGKWAHREEVHTWYKFPRDAEMPLVTDLKFIYFSSNLFCICLWNILLLLWLSEYCFTMTYEPIWMCVQNALIFLTEFHNIKF